MGFFKKKAAGSDAEGAARRDPEAYVALFLAAWDDDEAAPPSEPVAGERDIDYWPELDLDAAWSVITKAFHEGLADKGKTQLYFPGWFVRRLVTLSLIDEAAPLRPEVGDEFAGIVGAPRGADPLREDPGLDERIDAFLVRNHLSQIVDAFVQGLAFSAEE